MHVIEIRNDPNVSPADIIQICIDNPDLEELSVSIDTTLYSGCIWDTSDSLKLLDVLPRSLTRLDLQGHRLILRFDRFIRLAELQNLTFLCIQAEIDACGFLLAHQSKRTMRLLKTLVFSCDLVRANKLDYDSIELAYAAIERLFPNLQMCKLLINA